MSFEPIKKKRVYQYVIESIKESVATGEIHPGDKLPSERDLAKLLNVSRSAIREALSVMETANMLEIKTGIGVFLKTDEIDTLLDKLNILLLENGANLVEVLEVRQGIESQAAYLAAERMTEENLAPIEKALTSLESGVEAGQIAADEDYHFHIAVVNASKNIMLKKMIHFIAEYFIQGLHESRGQSLMIPGRSKQILQEHRDIYEAIKNKDPLLAREKMWNHLEHVKSRFN